MAKKSRNQFTVLIHFFIPIFIDIYVYKSSNIYIYIKPMAKKNKNRFALSNNTLIIINFFISIFIDIHIYKFSNIYIDLNSKTELNYAQKNSISFKYQQIKLYLRKLKEINLHL